MIKKEERVINILNKIDILVSEIDRLCTKQRIFKKNCETLEIEYQETEEIKNDTFKSFSQYIRDNLENNIYNSYLKKVEKTLDSDYEDIKNEIEEQIKIIDNSQSKQLYLKAQKIMYVSKWQNTQKEKQYYECKDTLKDKLTGNSKVKKAMIENIDLRSELIKKEYYEVKDIYNGQSIRETVNLLNNFQYKSNALIEFQEKIIKVYMIDEKTINPQIDGNWELASLVPTGFFEQRKYYKTLLSKLKNDNEEMKEKLNIHQDNIKEEKEDAKISKFNKLIEINKNLSSVLKEI